MERSRLGSMAGMSHHAVRCPWESTAPKDCVIGRFYFMGLTHREFSSVGSSAVAQVSRDSEAMDHLVLT